MQMKLSLILRVRVCVCVCEGTEPECRTTVGMLNYIKVDDCQSEKQIKLYYCEVCGWAFRWSHDTPLGVITTCLSVCLSVRANVVVSPSTPWRRLLWSSSVCAALRWRLNLSAFPSCAPMAPVTTTQSCLSPHVTVFLDSAIKAKDWEYIHTYVYPREISI